MSGAGKSTGRPIRFPVSGHEEGMDRPGPHERDPLTAPPSGPREREASIAALYEEHWPYVLDLLPSYRISAQDAEDVAQTAWMQIYRRRDSYDAATHKTPRAWITGFVQRCAANHRRAQRRDPVSLEEPGEQHAAPALSPEDAAILGDVDRMISNEEQRTALHLHYRHGLTIAEIAAIQEVGESTAKERLAMARRTLMSDDDEKKSRAFLGFGSMEALAEAMKPRPIPRETGERLWKKIVEQIRQEEAARCDSDPPPSSQPPAAALPAQASPTAPTLGALGNAKIAIVLLLAFLGGSGVLVWKANGAMAHGPTTAAMDAATAPTATASTSSAPTATATASTSSAPTATASTSSAPTATATASTSSTPATASSTAPGESQIVLARMREALNRRHFSTVLTLAAQHAQRFGATNVREREALRVEALRQTGRSKDAAEHARAVLAAYPEHRRAMERAAGQALP